MSLSSFSLSQDECEEEESTSGVPYNSSDLVAAIRINERAICVRRAHLCSSRMFVFVA